MTSKMYTPMWQALKKYGTVKIDITTSDDVDVQKKFLRTLRKAVQKEKYNDDNYRALYPNAQLSSTVINNGKTVVLNLDSGLSNNDKNMNELFGGLHE